MKIGAVKGFCTGDRIIRRNAYEKLSEILKKLEDGVKDIFNGDKYAGISCVYVKIP